MGHNAELKVYKTVLLEKENPILDHGFFFINRKVFSIWNEFCVFLR